MQSTHKNDTFNLIDFAKEKCNNNTCIVDFLNRNNICRHQAFFYAPGYFLFNTIQVLFHFHYSSIELKNGLIDHFFLCLARGDVHALESYQYDLEPKDLYQEHRIHDVDTYLHRM